jgi:glycosyltransferase involved in cell wall biosynthesis
MTGELARLSVVIPVYRDEESIRHTFLTVKDTLTQSGRAFTLEIILVNDGSPDRSLLVLEELHREFPEVAGVVSLKRNVGQVAAILAGMASASGDCVAVISSDLQDPPELIGAMFDLWQQGNQTVLGVREVREDRLLDRLASRIFYRMMKRYALALLPEEGFDFCLLDRSVANTILANRERNAFLQGQILSASGTVAQIRYTRRRRSSGRSGWTFSKRFKYCTDAVIAYSVAPIRFIAGLGVLLFSAGLVASAAVVVQRLVYGTGPAAWTTMMIAMLLLHGVELLMLAVLGEYLWRTLDQVRDRPLYLVDYRKLPSGEKSHAAEPAAMARSSA